ncbi:hypothetical protein [Massilibacteroides sp.]|uniref:hypothetical protein n=1 Tax=Massilibacteroides sp. TaxID=2034766 RepID=UPI00263656A6|nr:hypothetical protein [Massilibacteroides sp.]MDD4515682.1 hypothetical protein [Massilibacteroides sp.]
MKELDDKMIILLRAYKNGTYSEASMIQMILDYVNSQYMIGYIQGQIDQMNETI